MLELLEFILISMTIRAIWESGNDQDVAPNKTREVLKGLHLDLGRKSWIMEGGRRLTHQRELRTLWGGLL